MADQLLTSTDVQEICKIRSRVTLWRKAKDESDPFPKPYRFGSGFTRWKHSDIEAWIDSLDTA